MAYFKLARVRSNCYKDGDYGGNAYRGSHYKDGHFTHISQMGIGNFSSRAKIFYHIPSDDCCENSPYNVYKEIPCVQNFWRQDMEKEGKMDYYSYDIISFPPPLSHSCFGHFCKETKSCSFVLDLDRNSIQYAYAITSMSGRRYTL
ncbi:hypothetical protein M9H77_06927 [Catharanthus roseus]|uniref:Uncharacterized protein n=1 Tax=Catharanthus roseus TaxID=4058 RepID=A0ACC0BTR1_CATRO|nr:hypothetical protein M9H77_06927 [Catharanthus roseus]